MLDVVCSSGVVGRMAGCLPPNCEPKDREGRRERRGVGSRGLALGYEHVDTETVGTLGQG